MDQCLISSYVLVGKGRVGLSVCTPLECSLEVEATSSQCERGSCTPLHYHQDTVM